MSVLDTSAVLAVVYDEEGRDVVRRRLSSAVVSTVNLAEVVRDVLRRYGGATENAVASLAHLGLKAVAPDEAQAYRAAELKQNKGLSLADCFCIALGEARGELLVTGDQDWRALDVAVPIEFIRPDKHPRGLSAAEPN